MRCTLATALRVLQQIRRDPRTVALLLVVPTTLLALVKWVFESDPEIFQSLGAPLVGIFPLIIMFLLTSITMLRERTTGTLERLMTMPIGKFDLLAGYGIAFGLLAAGQATILTVAAYAFLGLETTGSAWGVVALAILNALCGTAMGLFASAFARTEFQAVQFMPAFVLPQLFLCGVFVSPEEMARALYWLSWLMPMTYAFDALDRVATATASGARFWVDVAAVVAVTVAGLGLGAATLRRRTA